MALLKINFLFIRVNSWLIKIRVNPAEGIPLGVKGVYPVRCAELFIRLSYRGGSQLVPELSQFASKVDYCLPRISIKKHQF